MTQPVTTCVLCGHRPADRGQVCELSARRLDTQLRSIGRGYALLPAALDQTTLIAIIDLTLPGRTTAVRDTLIPKVALADVAVRVDRVDYTGPEPAIVSEWQILRERRRVYDAEMRQVLIAAGDQTGTLPVAAVLATWVRYWAESRAEPSLAGTDVPLFVAWLRDRERYAWICEQGPALAEFATEIRTTLRMIRLALHRDLSPTRYAAPCLYCDEKSLRRGPGADWIECGLCGRLWGDDEYVDLARAAIGADEPLTTEEAALIAGVKPATIRQWRRRGHLPATTDEHGRVWQRRGDVDEAAMAA